MINYPITESGIVSRETFFETLKTVRFDVITTGKNKEKVLNMPAAFDIETTSTYTDSGEKIAFMYIWTFDFCGLVTTGRTWEEFIEFMSKLKENIPAKMFVYVHNLAFEFQFMRKYFAWNTVFALDEREPVKAITEDKMFEFRCSLILTGKKLERLAEDVKIIKIKKLVGDLDYRKVRTAETPLTEEELGYCENDVRIITAYIQQQIIKEGKITDIPLTKTGYVRRDVRKRCLYLENGKRNTKYSDFIKGLTIEAEEYKTLKQAFEGGFTHSNGFYFDNAVIDVASYDFTSSYPAVMVARCGFPVSKGRKISPPESKEEFLELTKKYCCVFEVFVRGIDASDTPGRPVYDHRLSSSRCSFWKEQPGGLVLISKREAGVIEDNGRIVSTSKDIITSFTCTEVDFTVIRAVYELGPVSFGAFWIYERGYLPSELVKAVLYYYTKKTELKGIPEAAEEYNMNKEYVNSIYGMIVTDILREEIIYDSEAGEWGSAPPSDEALVKYNENKNRFLFYPWGVYVTAWARYNLWTAILTIGKDYIYSDTDSVKIQNYERHCEYFEKYNNSLKVEMEKAMKHHRLSLDSWKPKNKKGTEKPLGYWDFEGVYSKFKTLGAKRYIYEQNGELHITIAGVGKKAGAEYLKKLGDPFEAFSPGLTFPGEDTGKLVHTYIDDEKEAEITDYTGNKTIIKAAAGVHLSPASYHLGISVDYMGFIELIKGVRMTRNRGEE